MLRATLVPSLALFSLVIGDLAHAATVHASAVAPDRNFLTSSGSAVPNGNLVRIGTFNLSVGEVQNKAQQVKTTSDLDALDGQFSQFGSITFSDLGGPTGGTGRFNQQLSGNTAQLQLEGKKIYWWVTKSTNNSPPDGAFSNIQEWGLFSGSGGEWQFPAEVSPDSDAAPTSGTITELYAGKLVATSSPIISPIPGVGASSTALQLAPIAIAPVPEPTTAALAFLATFWLAARRRR